MLADLSSTEYSGWEAFAQVEPIGMDRDDLHAGIIASTIANVNRNTKKKPKPFRFSDFMPFLPRPEANKSLAERLKRAFTTKGRSDGK